MMKFRNPVGLWNTTSSLWRIVLARLKQRRFYCDTANSNVLTRQTLIANNQDEVKRFRKRICLQQFSTPWTELWGLLLNLFSTTERSTTGAKFSFQHHGQSHQGAHKGLLMMTFSTKGRARKGTHPRYDAEPFQHHGQRHEEGTSEPAVCHF